MLKEGISHIEDLAIADFIATIKNIDKLQATEKLDGAQLYFGIDENNQFFTSREGKRGQRYYSAEDYGNDFWVSGFKSAHTALHLKLNLIKQIVKPNNTIEIEVLYGPQPNAIPYSSDTNYIVFLRSILGSTNLDALRDLLGDNIVSFEIEVPSSNDGVKIETRNEKQIWKFAKVPHIDPKHVAAIQKNTNINSKLVELEAILKAQSNIQQLTNVELISIKLNKRPDKINQETWSKFKTIIAEERNNMLKQIQDIKIGIKQELLINLVRKVSSKLGPKLEDGGWIEGIVFKDSNNNQVKLVDKDTFTAINTFNHQVRTEIQQDIWLKFKKDMAIALGYPELFGRTKNNFISTHNIDKLGNNLDIKKTKFKLNILVNDAILKLKEKLEQYQQERHNLLLKVGNKTKTYDTEIHKRTLQDFANKLKRFKEIKANINAVKTNSSNFIKIYLEESMGGKVFKTQDIKSGSIPATINYLSKITGISFDDLRNNTLGSAGKTSTSGDIDLAVDSNKTKVDDLYSKLKGKLGSDENVIISKGLNIIHAKVPVEGNADKGYVQVDFMFTNNLKWANFNFFSAGDKSKHKGAYRRRLLSAIIAATNETNYDNGELIRRKGWVWVPAKGLEFQIRERTLNKDGLRNKTFKVVYHGEIENDPETICRLLFPNDKTIHTDQLNSVEDIMNLIKNHKTQKEQDLIMQIFKQNVTASKLEYPQGL